MRKRSEFFAQNEKKRKEEDQETNESFIFSRNPKMKMKKKKANDEISFSDFNDKLSNPILVLVVEVVIEQ